MTHTKIFDKISRILSNIQGETGRVSNFRGRKVLKIEFIVACIILISVGLFSVERRDLFVETVLEQNYDELNTYRTACDQLRSSSCSASTLRSIETSLNLLDKPSFVLQDDVKLSLALVHEKLSEYTAAQEILKTVLNSTADDFSKADAAFQLAAMYEKRGQTSEAIRALVNHYELFNDYRRNEISATLMRLYNSQGNASEAGKYLIAAGIVPQELRETYVKLVKANWSGYSRSEKESILSALSKMKRYEEYAEYGSIFIREFRPDNSAVERMALELVYHSQKPYVQAFINSLTFETNYTYINREMSALFSLSGNTIDNASAAVRGLYYYRKLSRLNHLYSYSSSSALSYINDYLAGDVEQEYMVKNLGLAIRNLLAFKKYAEITNVVERAYARMNLDPHIGIIDKNVSFWNGYAHFQFKDYDRALEEFENCMSIHPDGYYAMNARDFILKILEIKGETLEDYLSKLDYEYISNPETFTKLHHARLLFCFRTGYGREMLRQKVVELMKQFSGDYLFEFDENEIRRLRSSTGYVKFVIYTRYGFTEKAKRILTSLGITDERKQDLLVLAQLVQNQEFSRAHDMMMSLGNDRFMTDNFAFLSREIKEIFYPRPYDSEIEVALSKLNNRNVDQYLVYSIIRQESMYMTRARSHAGARGLMQLMPATGRMVARSIWSTGEVDSYNALNNIMMGTRYISDNVRAYGFVTAVAAYNGGYSIIKKVRATYSPANEYELIEIIPFNETREYVKRVLTNYYRYREIYDTVSMTAYSPAIDRRLVEAR